MTPHPLTHDPSSGTNTSPFLPNIINSAHSSPPLALRRALRPKQPIVRLFDYDYSHARATDPNPTYSSVLGTQYPLSKYLPSFRLSKSHYGFVNNIFTYVEPTSFTQANLDLMWRDVMRVELYALEQNHTWTMTSLPPGKRTIGSK